MSVSRDRNCQLGPVARGHPLLLAGEFGPETAKPMRLCEPDPEVLAMGHQR